MLRWAALFLDSSLQLAKDELSDNVDMPSILAEFLTICVRSALRCRDGCLTGAPGDDMCYSRTVHCMATRRYQMAPAVDARCQDFYWGSSELTSYKDQDLRQKLESTAREREYNAWRVQNNVSRWIYLLPENKILSKVYDIKDTLVRPSYDHITCQDPFFKSEPTSPLFIPLLFLGQRLSPSFSLLPPLLKCIRIVFFYCSFVILIAALEIHKP